MDRTNAIPGITFDEFRAELSGAISRWGALTCAGGLRTSFVFLLQNDTQEGVRFVRNGANVNVATVRTLWGDSALFAPGAIAATLISYDTTTGALVDTDIALNVNTASNPDGFRFTLDPASDPGARDLATILTHELGHAHGLDHSDQTDTVMNPVYDRVTLRREPRSDDLAGICAIYPPARIARCTTPPAQPGCHCSTVGRTSHVNDALQRSTLVIFGWILSVIIALQCARSQQRLGPAGSRPGRATRESAARPLRWPRSNTTTR